MRGLKRKGRIGNVKATKPHDEVAGGPDDPDDEQRIIGDDDEFWNGR